MTTGGILIETLTVPCDKVRGGKSDY